MNLMPTDADLLQRYLGANDRGALDELFGRHYPSVFHVLLRICGNEFDARDLAQATFLKALAALEQYRGDGAFRPWLLKIAVNEFRDTKRRPSPHAGHDLVFEMYSEVRQEHALQAAERAEFEHALHKALAGFPEDLRVPLVLYYYQDLTMADIAVTLEIPKSTAHDRIRQALERLRREFKDKGFYSLVPLVGEFFPGIRLTTETASAVSGSGAGMSIGTFALGALAMKAKLVAAAAAFVLIGLLFYLLSMLLPSQPIRPRLSDEDNPVNIASDSNDIQGKNVSLDESEPEFASAEDKLQPEIHSSGPGSMAGLVLERKTRQPVAEAEITVEFVSGFDAVQASPMKKSPDSFLNRYYTGPEGNYTCTQLPVKCDMRITVRHPDFAYSSLGFTLKNSTPQFLQPILLDPALTITGMVTDESGRGLEGVRVSAGEFSIERYNVFAATYPRRALQGSSVVTDENGSFALPGLAAGLHRLHFEKSGYAAHGIPDYRVSPDSVQTPLHVALSAGKSISGRVVDENGHPVTDARILAMLNEQIVLNQIYAGVSTIIQSQPLDKNGRFTINDIPPGPDFLVTLTVESDAFYPATCLNIHPGDDDVCVQLRRRGNLTLVGQIIDEAGQLIRTPARLRAYSGDPRILCDDRMTSGDGYFEANKLFPGNASVEIIAEGFQNTTQPVFITTDRQTVSVQLSQGITISGCVRDEMTLQPIAGAKIVDALNSYRLGGKEIACITGDDGCFSLSGFDPSPPDEDSPRMRSIHIYASGYRNLRPRISLAGSSRSIALDLTMKKSAAYSVRGSVMDEEGNPVVDAWVICGTDFTSVEAVRTDTDGRFSAELVDSGADFSMYIDRNFETPFLPIYVTHPSFASQLQKVPEDELDREVKITLEKGSSLSGTVRDQHGIAVPNAAVVVECLTFDDFGSYESELQSRFKKTWFIKTLSGHDDLPNQFGYTNNVGKMVEKCDADGNFTLHRLPRGRYWVIPVARNHALPATAKYKDYLCEIKGQLTHKDLVLHRGGFVSGRVVDAYGKPMKGISVTADKNRTVNTDFDGNFFIDSLFKESVDIVLTQSGYSRESMKVLINTKDVVLTALPTGHLTGRLIDPESGNACSDITILIRYRGENEFKKAGVTSKSGYFHLDVPTGCLTLWFQPSNSSEAPAMIMREEVVIEHKGYVSLDEIPVSVR